MVVKSLPTVLEICYLSTSLQLFTLESKLIQNNNYFILAFQIDGF